VCPVKPNAKTAGWSTRYRTALVKHLKQGRGAGANPRLVQALGHQAVVLGLETLDLATAHEAALATLISPNDSSKHRNSIVNRAREFFTAAAVLIERTHRAAVGADALIHQLNQTLVQRTQESVASTLLLKQSIAHRRAAEAALKKSKLNHAELLAESHRLLKHVRQLTHTCLIEQEDDRKNVSRELQDDIAQFLLGIHIRLLTLKESMKISTASLKKELGSAQRLVQESTKKVKRFAHDYGSAAKA